MSTVKISALTEKATMDGSEEVLINDSGTSKKFSTQRFLDVKSDCETSESNASASAVAAAASAASAASVYDSFDDRYLGNKASDPATDNDGDALVQGMLYFDSTNSLMKVYDGSAWITTSSATLATLDVYKFTATSGQTAFTGTDDDGNTLAIKPTAEMVVMNGIVLEPTTDYTVTETTLTLTSGAALNDEVNVYAFGNFELADHYNKVASDARYYTQTQLDAGQLDTRYYTETEVDTSLAGKSDTSHNHSGVYEPVFTKNTGFNKDLGITAGTVSEGNHNHSGVYEPADATILKDADIGTSVLAPNGDGSQLTGIEGVPSGIISMWSGLASAIPSGWVICDGTNNTPNLTGKFIKGATTAGGTGGSATHSHTHTLSVGSHTLSIAEMPNHRHGTNSGQYNQYNGGHHYLNSNEYNYGTIYSSYQGGSGSHSHSLSGSITSGSNEPEYYALIYIMKS